jgi:hypothetical protein
MRSLDSILDDSRISADSILDDSAMANTDLSDSIFGGASTVGQPFKIRSARPVSAVSNMSSDSASDYEMGSKLATWEQSKHGAAQDSPLADKRRPVSAVTARVEVFEAIGEDNSLMGENADRCNPDC